MTTSVSAVTGRLVTPRGGLAARTVRAAFASGPRPAERCPVCARTINTEAVVKSWKWYCSDACASVGVHIPGVFLG